MESKIKTVEDAFAFSNIDVTLLPIVENLPERFQKKNVADYKVDVVIEALNNEGLAEPWVADYSDYSQDKFEIWWDFTPGVGWSFNVVADWRTLTHCGSRRSFRTRAIAKYFAENFTELMQDVL